MIAGLLIVAKSLAALAQEPAQSRPRPFGVGELATYTLNYFIAHGTGSMEVVGIDTVRGRPAYRFRFVIAGKARAIIKDIYSVNDTLTSWTDTATFQSLRFYQKGRENGRPHDRQYEMFPDTKEYTDGIGRAHKPSVPHPLDEIAMLYYLRSEPLTVGETKRLNNYFKPASNPITLRVLGRDTIRVAGRKYPAIVVNPIIKSKSSLFDEDADTRVWFSDDSARIVLQIQARMPIGKLTMSLSSYRASQVP
jgi:hypothetical protein